MKLVGIVRISARKVANCAADCPGAAGMPRPAANLVDVTDLAREGGREMRGRKGSACIRVVALTATIVIGLWQSVAFASPSAPDLSDTSSVPDGPSSGAAQAPPAQGGGGTTGSNAPQAPAQPIEGTSDSDSPGHETEDPVPPDHAEADALNIRVTDGESGMTDLFTVGRTRSEIDRNDDSSHGDVTVLAVGGNEIVGAHSDSDGTTEDEVAPFDALCESSEGQICLGLLFAGTESTEDDTSSSSRSDAALAFVCVGGTQTDPDGTCDGALFVDAASSHSSINKHKRSGAMRANARSRVAGFCLEGVGCAEVFQAESHSVSESTEDEGQTSRESCFIALGECQFSDPLLVSVPPDCPGDPGALTCVALNQGEGLVYVGGAQSRQEALHIDILRSDMIPGGRLVEIHSGTAETIVRAQEPVCPDGTPPPCKEKPPPPRLCPDGETPIPPGGIDDCPGGGRRIFGRGGPGLAVTGAGVLPFVALALILGTTGVAVLMRERARAII